MNEYSTTDPSAPTYWLNRASKLQSPDPDTVERDQVAFMECRNDGCKGEGPWFNDSGNREWFVYGGDAVEAWRCPVCGEEGVRYPY